MNDARIAAAREFWFLRQGMEARRRTWDSSISGAGYRPDSVPGDAPIDAHRTGRLQVYEDMAINGERPKRRSVERKMEEALRAMDEAAREAAGGDLKPG